MKKFKLGTTSVTAVTAWNSCPRFTVEFIAQALPKTVTPDVIAYILEVLYKGIPIEYDDGAVNVQGFSEPDPVWLPGEKPA